MKLVESRNCGVFRLHGEKWLFPAWVGSLIGCACAFPWGGLPGTESRQSTSIGTCEAENESKKKTKSSRRRFGIGIRAKDFIKPDILSCSGPVPASRFPGRHSVNWDALFEKNRVSFREPVAYAERVSYGPCLSTGLPYDLHRPRTLI